MYHMIFKLQKQISKYKKVTLKNIENNDDDENVKKIISLLL